MERLAGDRAPVLCAAREREPPAAAAADRLLPRPRERSVKPGRARERRRDEERGERPLTPRPRQEIERAPVAPEPPLATAVYTVDHEVIRGYGAQPGTAGRALL